MCVTARSLPHPCTQSALCEQRGLHFTTRHPSHPHSSVEDPPSSWCLCGTRQHRNTIYFVALRRAGRGAGKAEWLGPGCSVDKAPVG